MSNFRKIIFHHEDFRPCDDVVKEIVRLTFVFSNIDEPLVLVDWVELPSESEIMPPKDLVSV